MAELATSLGRDASDRQRALDAAIGQIERAFGQGGVQTAASTRMFEASEKLARGGFPWPAAVARVGGWRRQARWLNLSDYLASDGSHARAFAEHLEARGEQTTS